MAIVSSIAPVTLVGGSQLSEADLTIALKLAPTLVAADGGAQQVLVADQRPVAVIGDLDSISDAARTAFGGVLHDIPEQTSTDFDKALRHIDAPLVIAVGVLGGSLGHELSTFNGLVYRPSHCCIALGAEDLVFLCPPELTLDLPKGTPVSLFPMGPVQIESTGMEWPTDGLHFSPAGRIGTSNTALGPITLRAKAPLMLVILPRDCLDVAAKALLAQAGAGKWPAPDR